jgi:molecular chaperone Hsp33
MISVVAQGENIFGVAAVTTELVEEARKRHGSDPVVATALGRLMTGALLMSTALKEPEHRIILQIKSRGPIQRLVAEADGAAHVRGYPEVPVVDTESVPSRGVKLDVGGMVGPGMLHVVKEVGLKEPTTGAIALVSGEIGEDLATYLLQSEQIPSAVALGVFAHPGKMISEAGGFLIQFHATLEEDIIEHVEQSLANTPAVTTMLQEGYSPLDMLQRALGGMSMKVVRTITPKWYCPCSRDRVMEMLIAMGETELLQLIQEEEITRITCDYCVTEYVFERHELEALLREAKADV